MKTLHVYFFLILSLFLANVIGAHADGTGVVPTAPQLRLETGMHNSIIRTISIDAANKYLVTGSDDKTVRVWNAQTGDLLQTLRVPIDGGDVGKVYAVAISPDGATIACGGWMSTSAEKIYIFDRSTKRIIQCLTGLPNVTMQLCYSADGQYLAAGLGQGGGVRLYSAKAHYTLAGTDSDYTVRVTGLDFRTVRGELQLVSCSFDGLIRLYSVGAGASSLHLLTKAKAPSGLEASTIQFSPDGGKIVVGYNDLPAVSVLSSSDLSLLYTPDMKDLSGGNLASVAWSKDGKFLYAGGTYGAQDSPILQWGDAGQSAPVLLPGPLSSICSLQPRNAGGVFFGAADPAFGALDAQGKRALTRTANIPDYRSYQDKFSVSASGDTVLFAYKLRGVNPAQFSLLSRSLTLGTAQSTEVTAPRTKADGFDIQNWHTSFTPSINGKPIVLAPYEEARSVAIAPDNQSFVLGADWDLRRIDASGHEKWKISIPGDAWDVNITGNGKLVIAALADGTIRWYRMTDGQELLAFFPHADQKRWVAWTPTGYYDCSPGAESLIGWHVNRGSDQAADFFPVSKFRETYYRPDVIAHILDTLDESVALQQANDAAGRVATTTDVLNSLPPVVTILSPQSGNSVSTTDVTVTYEAQTSADDPITGVKLLIDGNTIGAERKIQLVSALGLTQTAHFAIPKSDCTLSVMVKNSHGFSTPASVKVHWQGKAEEFVIKPTLYILAVGVSKYKNTDLTLQYPAKDATDFVAALNAQKGVLYQDVQAKLLVDADATRDNIVDGLEWIERQTTQHDVAMVFLSGHGANDMSGNYLFIPDDFDVDHIRRTGLAFSDIRTSIANLAGKKLLFVDSCNSGNVMGHTRGINDLTGAINELTQAENGAVVFAASTGNQSALEDPQWHNGAFTKALVEALSGKADYGHNGKITVNMLDLYLSQRVKELTGGRQTPTTTKPETVPDFPVAFIKN